MRIRIACVGKLKEAYLKHAGQEYSKRISRYAQVEVCEVADEPVPEKLSEAQRVQALAVEGARLLKHIGGREYVVALCVEGEALCSLSFSKAMAGWLEQGGAAVTFVIGGSLGLSEEVLARADAKLSLSRMTFPHQLARILLMEQLYRAFKILNNQPYHK